MYRSLCNPHVARTRLPLLAVKLCPALLFCAFAISNATAQEILLNVNYVCNGERINVYGCDIHDLADTAWCSMGHPDKLKDGMMTYTNTTRGALKKLLPTCQQPNAQDVDKRKRFDKQLQDRRDADQKRADEQMKPADNSYMQGSGRPMTPEQRRIARCVTSGRVPATCTGNALMNGLNELTGNVLSSVIKDVPPGPVLAGSFEGAGKWRVEFSDRGATMTCSNLDPQPYAYSLQFRDNRAFVTLTTAPKPLVLAVRGGELAGAGPVVIDGRVITGYTRGGGGSAGSAGHYESQQTTTHQELTPLEATPYAGQSGLSQNGQTYDMASTSSQSTWVPGGASYSVPPQPIYAPRRANCAAPALSSKNAGTSGTEAATGLLTALFNNGDKGPPTPPGIRMHGIFAASTGFSVEFFPESAVLGCGPDAARAYPYTVIADGNRTAIKIDTPDHPLLLAMRSDGSLDPGASGPYQVHGRTLLNDHSDELHFSPFELSCNLAVLAPAKRIPESGGVSPARMNASSGGGTNSPSPATGNSTLHFVSGFPTQPGAPNQLANHPLTLLRTNFDDMVRGSGVTIPPNTTPFMYFATACGSPTPECKMIIGSLRTTMAATVKGDANGNGTLGNLAAGTYYLMVSTRYNNHAYTWTQPVQIKPGENSVTLDLGSAVRVN